MNREIWKLWGILLACVLVMPGLAFAQEERDVRDEIDVDVDIEADIDEEEPARFPEPPGIQEPRIVEFAGDTERPYASAGVLELGGWASINSARDFTIINLNPQVGWFLMNNVQISALIGLRAVRQDDERDTYFSALLEPSFHLPFTEAVYGFFGAGVGPSWSRDDAFGLAVQPRLGANFLIGRSGIFTPALFALYSTTGVVREVNGGLLGVDLLWGMSAGYTVMW